MLILDYLCDKLLNDIHLQISQSIRDEYGVRLNHILNDIQTCTGLPVDFQPVIKKGRPPIIKKKPVLILKRKSEDIKEDDESFV